MAAYPEHQVYIEICHCLSLYARFIALLIKERVWEEVQDVFGDSDRDCCMEDLPQLKFMDCCIKEALRLYPSAPLIERISTEDIQIGLQTKLYLVKTQQLKIFD